MAYYIDLEGFEGQDIEVQPPGFFRGAKLLVNGKPAPAGPKRGQMLLCMDDGTEVIASWEPNPLWLNPPVLIAGKKMVNIIEPLQWYDWMWIGLPLLIIIIGGNIGALVGLLGLYANTKIFYSQRNVFNKYVSAAGISIATALIYFVIMLLIPASLLPVLDG